MKFLVLLGLIVAAKASLLTQQAVDQEWNSFKVRFSKRFDRSEELIRKEVFKDNLERIYEHNLLAINGQKSYRLAVNEFADLTNEEFVIQRNGFLAKSRVLRNVHSNNDVSALPATVDWRTKGVVTPIKDQGQCGSCWAFSAVASIEGQKALDTKKLVSLSEQNLVDCSAAEGNLGCNGGLMDQAFQYVMMNKGIDTEASYPYEASTDSCVYKAANEGATVRNYSDVQTGNEAALQNAVATVGPISVAIDASQFSFQFYSSGVYDEPNCGNQMSDLDHGVTAVGYGTLSGSDYWLVKNSWGTVWGEKGYIMMSRNKANQCGISTAASYPTGVM